MPQLLPVIHVENEAQARAQVGVARDARADGVWLINHSIDATSLWATVQNVREDHPDFWLGVNFLDVPTPVAMNWVCEHGIVNGLWTDRSGVGEFGPDANAQHTWEIKQTAGWEGLYFGGVAFKYQQPVKDWAKAAKDAAPLMDVVTTSGPATGEAASLDKIRWMSTEAASLAIASGITPENVKDYLDWASYFLVATGISKSFTELDPERTKQLADIIHEV